MHRMFSNAIGVQSWTNKNKKSAGTEIVSMYSLKKLIFFAFQIVKSNKECNGNNNKKILAGENFIGRVSEKC